MTTTCVSRVPPRADPALSRPPNRLAQQITGRTYLSHSQLSLMRACPRKFSFQYVQRLPPDFVPSSLLLGGAIHAALELYFRARLEGLAVTREALLLAYHDACNRRQNGNLPVRFNKGEDRNQIDALADRIIGSFLNSPLAEPRGVILGVEEELRVVLDPGLPDVLAKVDLVTQTNGAVHVIDWKTSRSRWTQQKALESGDQLVLYGATVARMSRALGLPVKLTFAIVTKARKPIVQLLPVHTSAQRVAAMKDRVAEVWEHIQSGNFYPSPSPMNCTSCPYRSRCSVFAAR